MPCLQRCEGELSEPTKTKSYIFDISGLFLYDDLFPSQLKGKGPDGSEVTINACPELGTEVIMDFDQNAVKQIRYKSCKHVFDLIS